MTDLKYVYNSVVAPRRFIDRVVDYIVAEDARQHPQVVVEGRYPEARRAKVRESVEEQTANIRRALKVGLFTTASTVLLGTLIGLALRCLYGAPSKITTYAFQATGACLILGATLSEVGREILTWDRRSIPEQVNKFVFQALYVLGTLLFVLAAAWDASSL